MNIDLESISTRVADFVTANLIWFAIGLGVLVFTGIAVVVRKALRKEVQEAEKRSYEVPVRDHDYYDRRHALDITRREYTLWRTDNPPDTTPDESAVTRLGILGDELESKFSEYAAVLDMVLDESRLATILYRSGIGFRDDDLGLVTPPLIEVRVERSGLVLSFDTRQPPTPVSKWEAATEALALQLGAKNLRCNTERFGECWVMLRDRYTDPAGDLDQMQSDHDRNFQKWDSAIPDSSEEEAVAHWQRHDDFDDGVEVSFAGDRPRPRPQQAVPHTGLFPPQSAPKYLPDPVAGDNFLPGGLEAEVIPASPEDLDEWEPSMPGGRPDPSSGRP